MNSRKLLIGASSPIAYSYITTKDIGRPTPVLENPVSYCLLYDELWFLNRELCPKEIEGLNFVHFIDEEYSIKLPFDEIPEKEKSTLENWDWVFWQKKVDQVTGNGRKYRCDNHLGINFLGTNLMATPGSRANLFFDRFIATELGLDLAGNAPNSNASKKVEFDYFKFETVEKLIGPKLSSLQYPFGFWHPCLNDLRSDSSLKAFREKISSLSFSNEADIDPNIEDLNREYQLQLRKSLKDRFSKVSFFESTALFLSGFIPGLGPLIGASDFANSILSKIEDHRTFEWTRFMCELEEIDENKNQK